VPHDENPILRLSAILAKFTPELLPVHFTTTLRGYIDSIAATQPSDVANSLHAVLTDEMFLEELRSAIGDEAEITLLEPSAPLEADIQSPLFNTIKAVLKEHDPEATAVPFLLTGGTDAKHVTKLGTKVYGFAPGLYAGAGEGRRVHSHDERISVRSLQWGVRVLYEVVERFASGA
jgi:acetylornithine deacetylase/succinyl-diaminopimelate desuccinylase-like protein